MADEALKSHHLHLMPRIVQPYESYATARKAATHFLSQLRSAHYVFPHKYNNATDKNVIAQELSFALALELYDNGSGVHFQLQRPPQQRDPLQPGVEEDVIKGLDGTEIIVGEWFCCRSCPGCGQRPEKDQRNQGCSDLSASSRSNLNASSRSNLNASSRSSNSTVSNSTASNLTTSNLTASSSNNNSTMSSTASSHSSSTAASSLTTSKSRIGNNYVVPDKHTIDVSNEKSKR